MLLSISWSFLGSFSFSFLRTFPLHFSPRSSSPSRHHLLKFFLRNAARNTASNARLSHSIVAALALEESSGWEVGNEIIDRVLRRDGFLYLNLEDRDLNTYGSLLDGCYGNGSLLDAKKVQGRILKVGFHGESVLCEKLVDIYVSFGDFFDAVFLFDEMPHRSNSSWNRVIYGFLSRKRMDLALAYFSRMLREKQELEAFDPQIFATVLRACSGCCVQFSCVQKLHAKIVRLGLASDSVIGNPLIDLYNKSGLVDAAWLVFEEFNNHDRITWVAMMSGFSRNGREEEALSLYSGMCRLGVVPTSYVFSSILSACTKAELFEVGKQVHGHTFKWGLYSETFVCNALVSMYSRNGTMDLVECVVSKMSCVDTVTYNSLISAHVQGGNVESVFRLFRGMQYLGSRPDCVTTASLLSACASIGAATQGQQLHSHVIKSGMTLDIIIEGSLLDFYVNCADIDTAYHLFSTTRRENIVLWNVMLMGYGRMGKLRESCNLFRQMQALDITPNQYTYPSILRTCTLAGALDLGEQIHSLTIRSGLELNVYVSSVLIDMYCKCGRLIVAREILGRLCEKDVVSWTAMISGYAQNDLFREAIRTFQEMLSHGIRPDNIGLSSAISACAGMQAFKRGLQIHSQSVILGYSGDISIGNAVVCLYARCGRVGDAYLAFGSVEVADEGTWNGLISGFAQSGHFEEALMVFRNMNRAGIEADFFTYGSAIFASANMADAKQGKQIHAQMVKTGYDICETETGNTLITLYSKCGSIKDAKIQFSTMLERNEVSWNAMITGYSRHGCGNEVLRLFEQMKLEGLEPNHVTFVGVLSACSHVGLVNKGLRYFDAMSLEHGIPPRPEHYACVVDILGRAGQLDRARKFVDEMPIPPDSMVWKTLLSACKVHKNVEIGEFAAHRLLELEPHDSATYVLLSNIYAVAKQWKCRDTVRQLMKSKGVKKEPGCSWIEVKNLIHVFFVGDKLHPLAGEIYRYLEEINEKAVKAGYIQDKDSVLHDIELEQKDPSAYVHSEKIAIAFGLISLSSEMPIRVIKNLRICNDCHSWMKYVSTVTERAFVVRDAFRYHHFDGGACSCQDYW